MIMSSKGKVFLVFSLVLLLYFSSNAAAVYSINCSQSTTSPNISCTFNSSSNFTVAGQQLMKNVGGTLVQVCNGYGVCSPSAILCNQSHTVTYDNNNSCTPLQPNINYTIKLDGVNCSDSAETWLYGNVSTYACYPGQSLPPGYVCSNNQIVLGNFTATQVLWTIAPTSASINDYTNFQIYYQTVGQIPITVNVSCNLSIIELNSTYAMSQANQTAIFTLNSIWASSGTYHYYASCNASNISSNPFIRTNSSINSIFVSAPLSTTPTTLTSSTLPTYSNNLSVMNGSLSPANNWTCGNMPYLLLSGNITQAALCPFVYSFGPVWFFGLMLLMIVVIAYIKTRIWEAPALLAFLWTGAFAPFFPYIFGTILMIGGAVGIACIALSIYNREGTT